MAEPKAKFTSVDPVWQRVREEAAEAVRAEPLLGGLIHASLLHHSSLERALAYRFYGAFHKFELTYFAVRCLL